jgi:integrase
MRKPRSRPKRWCKVPRTIGLYLWKPSGVYFVNLRKGGRLHRESLKTKDLAVAKRKLHDFRLRLDRTDSRYGKISLVDWLENIYFPTLRGSDGALKAKWRIIQRLKTTWVNARGQPMRDLRPSEVLTWLNREYGDWSHSYWNSAVTVIRDALEMAVNDRVLLESPAAGLRYRKRKQPIRPTPTYEQFKAIIADIRSQKFNGHEAEQSADFVEFCGLAGLGQIEVAAIKRSDIDLDAGRIVVYRHKTDTGFVIPVYPQLRPLVEKLCEGKKPNDHLFAIAQARKAIANACKRLEFPAYTHRSLRRMFIVRALEKGIDVKTVSEW